MYACGSFLFVCFGENNEELKKHSNCTVDDYVEVKRSVWLPLYFSGPSGGVGMGMGSNTLQSFPV